MKRDLQQTKWLEKLALVEKIRRMADNLYDGAGCIVSKDIGQYDACLHLCTFCYSNSSGRGP
jgi:hypothetical protein